MVRFKLFLAWYRVLRSRNYNALPCVEYAWYNSKYYTADGKNRV